MTPAKRRDGSRLRPLAGRGGPARITGVGALLLLFGTLALAAESQPLALLDRMNEAIRNLDYEGRFVVQSGERLDALYLVHRVNGGSEKERVVSLTGEPREIIRGDAAVACLVPGRSSPINVGRRAHGRSYSPLNAINGRELQQHYAFELLAPDRVAGRIADQILIQPRDALRFGYRVFVDRETGLPLRTMTIDQSGGVRSQMMFTDLKVGPGVTPIERDLAALQVARADPADWSPLDRLAAPAWTFAEAPPGFQLNVHRRRALDDKRAELEHFIFSDGLATVSVYVQPTHDGQGWTGASRHGAANAMGHVVGQHEIIVVGEVPVETLEWFARAIRAAQ